MRSAVCAALVLGSASLAAAQAPDRGPWGRVALTGRYLERTSDDYAGGPGFGLDLAAGVKRGRDRLWGMELDLYFSVPPEGGDFQGVGYGAALLGVHTRYLTGSSAFYHVVLGVAWDGEAADYSFLTRGPMARLGFGVGAGVVAPIVALTAMVPVNGRDFRGGQSYGLRLGLEVGMALTFR